MEPFATLDELIARCDWTFDDDELRVAPGYLEEASDLARVHGRATWDSVSAPRMVKNIVISAVRRYMRNPEGYTVSRAGDETVQWSDYAKDPGTIAFTDAEIKVIRSLAGGSGIRSSQVTAYGPRHSSPVGQVPVSGWPGEKPFPYYSSDTSPW